MFLSSPIQVVLKPRKRTIEVFYHLMLTEHVKGINGEGEWRAIHESYMNQKEENIKKE